MKVYPIQIIISVVAIVFLMLHLVFPSIELDITTLFLIVISFLPWIGPIMKSIEINGLGKVEFKEINQEMEKIVNKVEETDSFPEEKISNKKGGAKQASGERGLYIEGEYPPYSFEEIEDKSLALAGLRIELEKKLKDLAEKKHLVLIETNRYRGTYGLLKILSSYNVISPSEKVIIADLLPLLNSAVHGQEFPERSFYWAMDIGPQILRSLDKRINQDH